MSPRPDPDRDASLGRVVMVVANEVTPDARVSRMAASLARAGFDVTVLGRSTTGYEWHTQMGAVRIVRVAPPTTHRDLAQQRATSVPGLAYRRFRAQRAQDRAAWLAARLKIERRECEALAATRKEALAAISRARKEALIRWLDDRDPPRVLRLGANKWMQLRRWISSRLVRLSLWGDRLRLRLLTWRQAAASERSERARRSHDEALERARRRRPSGTNWRNTLPGLHDDELAFGPALEDLQPDVIHAHGIDVIGIAARAAARLRGRGLAVKWVYDAREYVRGLGDTMPAFRRRAYADLQDEYISRADGVLAASEQLAELLVRDHDLRERPTVVLDAPIRDARSDPSITTIRDRIAAPDDAALLVYCGPIESSRRVDTLVRALEHMPDVHVALVGRAPEAYVEELRTAAAAVHARERLHVVGHLPSEELVQHVAGATVGVALLSDCVNDEALLPEELLTYVHAGLPVLTADVGTSAQFVHDHGLGESFRPHDPRSLAATATSLLTRVAADREVVAVDPAVMAATSWQAQEEALLATYDGLVTNRVVAAGDAPPLDLRERPGLPEVPRDVPVRVLVGPHNTAGQAMAWSTAVHRTSDQVYTEVHSIRRGGRQLPFDADVPIPMEAWKDRDWQQRQLQRVLADFTHVLFEGGSPVAGTLIGSFFTAELPLLQHHGIRAALVFHGSDVRDPRRHRQLERHSPFGDDPLTRDLQQRVDRLRPQLEAFDGPVFVSTNGLLDHVPDADWLPVVVDLDAWTPPAARPALRSDRPTVLHVSTNSRLKGGRHTLEVCQRLHDEGALELVRPDRVEPAEMPAVMGQADVYVDGTVLGDYGVTACQAMAMNRLVVGNVSARVRSRIPTPVPVLQADPSDLEDVLRKICDDPAAFQPLATSGRAYVTRFHDGTVSAAALRPFLET